jgi:hypothetical protein
VFVFLRFLFPCTSDQEIQTKFIFYWALSIMLFYFLFVMPSIHKTYDAA